MARVPTANQHDAIAAVELALAEAQRLVGRPLIELTERHVDATVEPLVMIVTDNDVPFRSFGFDRAERVPGAGSAR